MSLVLRVLVVLLALATPARAYECFTIPNRSAAAYAAQSRVFSQDAMILAAAQRGNGVIYSAGACQVTAQGTPNMTVHVAGCSIAVGGSTVSVSSADPTIAAAAATNPRIDLISANSSGTVVVTSGTAAAEPEPPTIPESGGAINTVLAFVYVPPADTAINANQIVDKRPCVAAPGGGGGGGGAPADAKYITKRDESGLSAEQSLGSLTTGLLLNTVVSPEADPDEGTLSPYTGTVCTNQFARSLNASGVATCASVALGADVSGDLPFANLTQGSALSVLGVAGNATADHASIAAGSDHQALRRSGTAVAFGAINLASGNAVTGTLPAGNGGTGLTAAADDNVAVGNGTVWQSKALPSCAGGTDALSYDTSTNAFGCNTIGGAGGGDFSSNTATSVDSEVVLFSGTGGKTGKRATGTGPAKLTSGVLSTGTIAIAEGGTSQTTAAAARGSSGLNLESATARGDANYTILATDRLVYTNASLTAVRTWTLPAANAVNGGHLVCIFDGAGGITAANNLVVQRAGSDTVDGATDVVLETARQGICLRSNGSNAWLSDGANVGTAGLTPGALPKASAGAKIADSCISDDGTTVTITCSGGLSVPSVEVTGAGIGIVGGAEGTLPSAAATGEWWMAMDSATHTVKLSQHGGAAAKVLTSPAGVADGGTGITSGTSGGVPYFSASGTIASSGALTANQPVIGGGAGTAPTVGTRTGNTTAFVTSTGSLTTNNCAKWDANGNLVDHGSACGGGGATDSRISTVTLGSDVTSVNTTTGAEVTGIQKSSTGTGTFSFRYLIRYHSTTSTLLGARYGVNHTGTVGWIMWNSHVVGLSGAADQDFQAGTGASSWSAMRALATTSLPIVSTSVDTINADMMVIIEGLISVTGDGDLELWHACEGTGAGDIVTKAGSALILTKVN